MRTNRIFKAALWLLLALLSGLPLASLQAAGKKLSGPDIFRKQCAECHGKKGEGVHGKYDEALFGDWSIEKLSRVITKTMPDDEPEKCVGQDAEAVARYIYDTFYSREARARNNPARVELVHLTNRQYVTTVADLLKHFSKDDPQSGKEHGLRGTYYNSRSFNKKVFDRLDPEISFDFGDASPEPDKIKQEEFSMRWVGSIRAEESGDYEFIVKTPNGMRLWVNDRDRPLIDAWVASGEKEHHATIRLMGGRIYPVMLDCFKFKDKSASIAFEWIPPHGAQELVPARNLIPVQVRSTFVVATPFPPDDSSVGYERGTGVSKSWDEATTQAAIEVANHVAERLDSYARSKAKDADRSAKVQAFCEEFVQTAFRRPLTDEQKKLYVTSHFKDSVKLEDSVKRVVLLTLKSPRFLYLGLERNQPDDFTVAENLSFALWDSLPDKELWKQAVAGNLKTHDQVAQQAQRMLPDERTHSKMLYFLHHWLQLNRVEDVSKDSSLYPGFTPEIIADLRTSLNIFLEDTVWNGNSDYRQLLLADTLFMNGRLAKFYGAKAGPQDEFIKVKLDPKQRSGVVTHPYLLAAFSYQKSTSPIHRGVFLTRNIVGRTLKPPPVAVAFKDADFDPKMTMREKVSELTRPRNCQTCHSVINPLGFSLELYDAVGRFRTKENGRDIDAVSEYITDDGEKVRFNGARDLAEFAVNSDSAKNAFIEQLFHQTVKQPIMAYGPKVMDDLRQSFAANGFNMQKLLVEIATISATHGVDKPVTGKK